MFKLPKFRLNWLALSVGIGSGFITLSSEAASFNSSGTVFLENISIFNLNQEPENQISWETELVSEQLLTRVEEEIDLINKEQQKLEAIVAEASTPEQLDLVSELVDTLQDLRFQGLGSAGGAPNANVQVLARTDISRIDVGIYGFEGIPVQRTINYAQGLEFAMINPVLGPYSQNFQDPTQQLFSEHQYGSSGPVVLNELSNFGDISFEVNLPETPTTELATQLYTAYRQDITLYYQLQPFGELDIEVNLPMMPGNDLAVMTRTNLIR